MMIPNDTSTEMQRLQETLLFIDKGSMAAKGAALHDSSKHIQYSSLAGRGRKEPIDL